MEEEKELKEEKEPKKKSNSILVTVLVICLLAVFTAFGWLAGASFHANYEKIENNNNTGDSKEPVKEPEKEPKEENQTASKSLTEEEVRAYLDDYDKVVSYYGNKLPLKASEFTNQEVLRIGYSLTNKSGTEFPASDVREVIERIFGKDFVYQIEDVDCFARDGILYKYDASTQMYSFYGNHGHDGGGAFLLKIFFIDAKESDDTITINTKILYGNHCGGTCGPTSKFHKEATYADYTNSIYDAEEADWDNYDKAYEAVKDQLPITSFILKKQSDGNYGLSEITVE